MALMDAGLEGWRTTGPGPYHVERIEYGPHYAPVKRGPPQVCSPSGAVAITGPHGAVFCATDEQADALCALANAGQLGKQ